MGGGTTASRLPRADAADAGGGDRGGRGVGSAGPVREYPIERDMRDMLAASRQASAQLGAKRELSADEQDDESGGGE